MTELFPTAEKNKTLRIPGPNWIRPRLILVLYFAFHNANQMPLRCSQAENEEDTHSSLNPTSSSFGRQAVPNL